jgi:hypothetical protein
MEKKIVLKLLKNQTCENCRFRLYRQDLHCSFRAQLPEIQTCDNFLRLPEFNPTLGVSSRGYGV